MGEAKWLDGYSGQTTDELIALEGEYRTDSLVLAFEQALMAKDELTDEERVVLAVEALEREVNNGGYDQLFLNVPEQAPYLVSSLRAIGCEPVAALTQEAIDALGIRGALTVEAIEAATDELDEERDQRLSACGDRYYESAGDLAGPLLEYIKAHRNRIALG
jgi:hypothetical protein